MLCHVFNRFLKKTYNLPLKFEYFHFSVSSITFLTASWLPIFVSVRSSRTVLSIDRSEHLSIDRSILSTEDLKVLQGVK